LTGFNIYFNAVHLHMGSNCQDTMQMLFEHVKKVFEKEKRLEIIRQHLWHTIVIVNLNTINVAAGNITITRRETAKWPYFRSSSRTRKQKVLQKKSLKLRLA